MGRLVAVLGFILLFVICSSNGKKATARRYVKCDNRHFEVKFFARHTTRAMAAGKCKRDNGTLATARTSDDTQCLRKANMDYQYRGRFVLDGSFVGLSYHKNREQFVWERMFVEPEDSKRWKIKPTSGVEKERTCVFTYVDPKFNFKLGFDYCTEKRPFFCERKLKIPVKKTESIRATPSPKVMRVQQPQTTQPPTTKPPTTRPPARAAAPVRVRRSAPSRSRRTLAILGFGSWKPVEEVSIPYRSPVRPYVGHRVTYCIADYDYPKWTFNYGPIPTKMSNAPTLYQFTKEEGGKTLYVNGIRWPKECRAVVGLNGAFRCSSADGQQTLRAIRIRVTGLPNGDKKMTLQKPNKMKIPPHVNRPTQAPKEESRVEEQATEMQQTTLPVTTPTPTNATTPPTTPSNATEPTTSPIEFEAAGSEASSVNPAAIIVPIVLLLVLLLALIIIRQRRRRLRKNKKSKQDKQDYLRSFHSNDVFKGQGDDIDRTYSSATRRSYVCKNSINSQQADALNDADMSDTGFSLSQDSFDDCASYFNHHIYDPPALCEEDLHGQLSSRMYLHIALREVEITEELGSGQFGMVHQGLWTQSGKYVKDVAVKELRDGASSENRVKLLQEAAIMGQFKHRNVVELFGVVTEANTVMLVIELMSCDLRGYLRNLEHPPPDDIVSLFLEMSQDVAEGMAYLASCKFIHRDLAARNIMLDEELNCKIGDFGMSRDLSDEDYYFSTGGEIPLKWTAPEAILYRQYSTMSDVWSYGILLAEVFTFGRKPYFNMTNAQVLSEIQNGYRMPQPDDCPDEVYEIMKQCWNEDRRKRPTFSKILRDLQEYNETLA